MIKVVFFIYLLYTLPTNVILSFHQNGHQCKYLNIITTSKGKVGAKSKTEIISIFTNFSFVSYDNDKGIFTVSLFDFLIWTSA